ncbi:cysteine hydrolase family protein [Actimicrobium sp. CCI2.3]|uniref:cysteine hydrolase family protein n=1 Tax=Actimicrobium sp. CCI2.3 TaxID=3048616 RepID=UPI002AB42B9E|nr:cysteine hydrolase family protein [Actimicrobium sp. CCI2.3]MDY7574775.1 cysteine hydrolase family protein [Actimicrobium sp. CCI2.3]MEB0020264.1 cysteine hydrolase family protein [Actimicrobium sp. CCI2.3]
MHTALLIIDIQNDYFPGGTMELVGADAASRQAKLLLDAWRANNLPVFHVQHIAPQPDATFFRPNTVGAQIHENMVPIAGETLITKATPNSFHDTSLLESLRAAHITHLVVVGMMTHMCVDSTVRAASDLGFVCQVVHDACATRDLTFGVHTVPAATVQATFMAALNGTFCSMALTAQVLDDLPTPSIT